MRVAGDRVGPRGLAVLVVVALGGIALAVYGWSGRHAVLTPGSLAAGSSGTSAAHPAAGGSAARHPRAAHSAAPSGGAGAGHVPPAKAGPLLSSQSYAPYSFLVWPGTLSAAAKAAMTGLTITVHRTGQGISVTGGVSGQPASSPTFYASGAKVYVVEASMGDDANSTDYNLGDDGLVVTDSSGRIVQ
jgi:hypothetical protein